MMSRCKISIAYLLFITVCGFEEATDFAVFIRSFVRPFDFAVFYLYEVKDREGVFLKRCKSFVQCGLKFDNRLWDWDEQSKSTVKFPDHTMF